MNFPIFFAVGRVLDAHLYKFVGKSYCERNANEGKLRSSKSAHI